MGRYSSFDQEIARNWTLNQSGKLGALKVWKHFSMVFVRMQV